MLLIVRAEDQFIGVRILQLELHLAILAVLDPHQIFCNVRFPLIHRHILDRDGVFRFRVFRSHSYQDAVALRNFDIVASKFRRQNNRAIFERCKIRVVCRRLNFHFHGHGILDLVA